MKHHYIVCGLGHVGYRIVKLLLRLDARIAVLTTTAREEWVEEVRAAGVIVLFGDVRNDRLLLEVGLMHAQGLIVATDQDVVNIEVALDAKTHRPDIPVVIRLFDQTLAQQMEATLDVRRALAMSVLAAPAFTGAVMGENVVGSFSADGKLFVIGRIAAERLEKSSSPREELARRGLAVIAKPGEESETAWTVVAAAEAWDDFAPEANITGKRTYGRTRWRRTLRHYLNPLSWTRLARQVWLNAALPFRALFIGLVTLIVLSVGVFKFGMKLSLIDAIYFITTTITTTGYGDIALLNAPGALKLYGCLVMILGSMTIAVFYSILTDFIVTSRFEQLVGSQGSVDEEHVILVGLGNVGFRIAEELKRLGVGAVAIERNADSQFVGSVRPEFPVFIGDARTRETLTKAGIEKAKAVIAATDNDAVNLSVCLAAKQMNSKARTVVRFVDPEFARKVQKGLRVDTAMSAAMIAAPTFVAAAALPDVRNAFTLGDQLIAVRYQRCDPEWVGKTPLDIRSESLRIVMRKRDDVFIPVDDTPLVANEQLLTVNRIPLRTT